MRTISRWPECWDVGACLSQQKIEEQGNEAGGLMACSANDLTARLRKDGVVHTTRPIQGRTVLVPWRRGVAVERNGS
jgi:hypothetical protein